MRGRLLAAALLACAPPLHAQSVVDRSPNHSGVWALPTGHAAFVFAHRFELQDGGDELLNIPTMTLAVGVPFGLTAGVDYSSNSEVVRERGGNEAELWLKRPVALGRSARMAVLGGYNTAARSWDAAAAVRGGVGPLTLLGEVRAFSDLLGAGEPGASAVLGAALRLTPFLALTADAARVLSADSFGTAWSAATAFAIPGTPHTLSLQATNGGSITLHGASVPRSGVFSDVRYGFVFTVPLGTGSRWARIFRPAPSPTPQAPPAPPADDAPPEATVALGDAEPSPVEVRIRAGGSVEWIGGDGTIHHLTGEGWSVSLGEGDRYVRRFPRPGRYRYRCGAHAGMEGVVRVMSR